MCVATKASALKVNWHARLGHPGENKMRELAKSYPEKFTVPRELCLPCKQAKMKQGPYFPSEIKSNKPLELIHFDLAGPHNQVVGFDGSLYFIAFVDDYSRFTKAYPVKSRTEALNAFKRFRQFVESHCDFCIKRIRTDQARELLSNEFEKYLLDSQIWHELRKYINKTVWLSE